MIVLTGDRGFVGRRIARALGTRVVGIDRVEGGVDCLDVDHHMLDGCETLIHAAAHADISRNWQELDRLYTDNVAATWTLLCAASKVSTIRRVVLLSSCAVYGDGGPHLETDPVTMHSPYAASKLAGESFVQAFAARCGWRWYAARLAACLGPGYSHGHVADFVRMAGTPEGIVAKDAGVAPKDVVHVDDAADAVALMATGDLPSGVYNVAGGVWGWRDTLGVMGARASEGTGVRGWIGDSVGMTVDTGKLRAFGWRSTRTPRQGVEEALMTLGWRK